MILYPCVCVCVYIKIHSYIYFHVVTYIVILRDLSVDCHTHYAHSYYTLCFLCPPPK